MAECAVPVVVVDAESLFVLAETGAGGCASSVDIAPVEPSFCFIQTAGGGCASAAHILPVEPLVPVCSIASGGCAMPVDIALLDVVGFVPKITGSILVAHNGEWRQARAVSVVKRG